MITEESAVVFVKERGGIDQGTLSTRLCRRETMPANSIRPVKP